MHLVMVQSKSQVLYATDSCLVCSYQNALRQVALTEILKDFPTSFSRKFPNDLTVQQNGASSHFHFAVLSGSPASKISTEMDKLWRPWYLATWISWPLSTSLHLLAAHTGNCARSSIAHPLLVFGVSTRNVWSALAYRHDKCRAANGALTEGLGTGKCQSRIWSSHILTKYVNFQHCASYITNKFTVKSPKMLCVFLLLFTGLEAPILHTNYCKNLTLTLNTLRTGSFKLFKRPFPDFLTIWTL